MFTKKILIDLDGVLNEYEKDKFNENVLREIIAIYLMKLKNLNLGIESKILTVMLNLFQHLIMFI